MRDWHWLVYWLQIRQWIRVSIGMGIVLLVVQLAVAQGQTTTPRPIHANDANNLTLLTFLEGHSASIAEIGFNPTSTAFLTGGLDGQVCIWNIEALGQLPGQLRLCLTGYLPGVSRFAWTSDGKRLMVWWGGDTENLAIYRVSAAVSADQWASIEPTTTWAIGDLHPLSIQVLDSTHLLLVDIFNTLALYDTEAEEITFSKVILDYALLDDEILLLDENGRLNRVAVDDGEVTSNRNLSATHLTLSADAAHLLTWGKKTQLWDITNLDKPLLELATQPVDAVFSPDNQFLATWEGEIVTLWNLATGDPTETLINHRGGVHIMQFNADGRRFLSVSARGTGRFWQLNGRGDAVVERWIDGEIDGIRLAPDGETLVLTRESFDGRFYNFSNGQLRGNAEAVSTQALFSPDWTLVAKVADNRVEWYGLRDDSRKFDWSPFGVANGIANVRATPDQNLPRIAALPTGSAIFARGRSADNEWVYIQLTNNMQGWVWAREVKLNEGNSLGDLPVIEVEDDVEAEATEEN